MLIETLPLSRLKPAPYNPRVTLKPGMPRYERLARSLEEFDLVQPLVWNRRSGHVVGGHQRLAILQSKGVTETPCVVVDLDGDREKVLNVALNNANVGGDWDTDAMLVLLGELSASSDVDATLTGFSDGELRELLFEPELDRAPIDAEDENAFVDVTLEVPRERWPEIETWVDALLAGEPTVRVHVAD